MDILVWLARSSNFVTEDLSTKMMSAFIESELPIKDLDQRRRYMSYITHSQAAKKVGDIISQRIHAFTQQKSNDAITEMNYSSQVLANLALETLKWPLRVLEILLYNTEQIQSLLLHNRGFTALLMKCFLIINFEAAAAHGNALQASVIVDIVKTLVAILIR